jgi:BASS family bile acid:Na+ symporter
MVIVTSLAVPFILPILVYVLYNTEFSVPIFDMIFLLVVSLVFPLVTSGLIKKYLPKLATTIKNSSLPLSIILMDMINFAIFSNFSIYFYFDSSFVILTTVIAILLFVIFAIIGYFMLYLVNIDSSIKYRISGLIVMSYVNNILVTVFAQQFFGSQVAALAAFYNIPYYMGIILLKLLFSRKVKIGSN